jgi:ABC-type branched-subunit amino acid transport system ATPase component
MHQTHAQFENAETHGSVARADLLPVESLIVERMSQMHGFTLVVVSHYAKVLSMTQRLIALEQGRLLANGLTERMLKS